ncbi:MAG TPA: hypothetical protein PKW55_03090 [Spirochaetota bacterium]|nr:hypothetical protein [Spirochaetota bacterium]HOM38164.1 hypothetical protein [Spirochaetota bacterium]HPQ48618.1 hypothetical protein [Spirochaetota bacterium]
MTLGSLGSTFNFIIGAKLGFSVGGYNAVVFESYSVIPNAEAYFGLGLSF